MLFAVNALTGAAAERTLSQKRIAAANALKGLRTQRGLQSYSTENIRELRNLGEVTVLGYADGGFAVISNDDRNDAVIGYSASAYSEDNLPDGFRWYLEAVNNALSAGIIYAAGSATTPAGYGYKESVAPMITTKWDQSAPYWTYCPVKNGVNTLTGCVATAMAQIMYFHRYPESGTGNVACQSASVTLGEPYDWENMLPVYGSSGYTDAEADAVAKLMYHCGVAVNMNYGTSAEGGSGTTNILVSSALRKNFKYNQNVGYRYRGIHTTAQWMDMVYGELDSGRPILYGGADASRGGHAFVLHGYDNSGKVYVNWGWSGSSDGYYDLALLNPTGYEFSVKQDMVVGIDKPEATISHGCEVGGTGDLSVSVNSTPNGGKNLKVSYSGNIYNFNDYTFYGSVQFTVDGNGILERKTILNLSSGLASMYGQKPITGFYDPTSLPDGEYRIYLTVKEKGYDDYLPMPCPDGAVGFYTLVKSGDNITLTPGKGNVSTGIEGVTTTKPSSETGGRIYSIDGRYVGKDLDALGKGIYVVNGKKVLK